jgi:hypothetical protein
MKDFSQFYTVRELIQLFSSFKEEDKDRLLAIDHETEGVISYVKKVALDFDRFEYRPESPGAVILKAED